MTEATAQGGSEQPPSRPLYRQDGEMPSVKAQDRAITQNSELSPRWTARNGGVAGEAGSHVCGWPTLVLSLDGAVAENDPNTRRVMAFTRDHDPATAGTAPLSMGGTFLPGWGRGCCAYETRTHHCQ